MAGTEGAETEQYPPLRRGDASAGGIGLIIQLVGAWGGGGHGIAVCVCVVFLWCSRVMLLSAAGEPKDLLLCFPCVHVRVPAMLAARPRRTKITTY